MDNNNITLPIQVLQQRFKEVIHRLPVLVGGEVVNFALDNFKRQAWLGESMQRWPKRKDPTKWGMKVKRPGRALLVDSGRLRQSIRIITHTMDSVTVGSDVPYAKAHNDGVRLGEIQQVKSFERKVHGVAKVQSIKTHKSRNVKVQTGMQQVKAFTRRIDQRIPARRFIGNSPYLNARLQRVVSAEILRATKP
jgi:phage gpG-like protein